MKILQSKAASKLVASLAKARPYKRQNASDLINSYLVFKMCGMPFLVNNVPNFVKLSKKTGTEGVFNYLVKSTFSRHFCGGEDLNEVLPTMEKLAEDKIGTILDLAHEADLDVADLTGVVAQKQTVQLVNEMKACIDIASHQPDSFIAAKITALVPPGLLLSWSLTLDKLQVAFNQIAGEKNWINLEEFHRLVEFFPNLSTMDMEKVFKENDLNNSGTLTFSDITSIFSLFRIKNCHKLVNGEAGKVAGIRWLTHEDLDTAELLMVEIKKLCEYAKDKKVKIMMDAEQTYFQPAIDNIVLGLCAIFNPKITDSGWTTPLIYNTYQMYLKNALRRLKDDVLRAEQKGYSLGVKLVRGAYMVSERERATKLGYPSPICDTIEDTHKSFNDGIDFFLKEQAKYAKKESVSCPLSMTVASHNHESIGLACEGLEKYQIPRNGGWVSFAQLLGMQDGVTGLLASEGYRALKYVPYGPTSAVIAYLHRRGQENAQMIHAMSVDKKAIRKELITRLLG